MAIERQTPDPVASAPEELDMTTTQDTDDLDNQIIEVLEGLQESDVEIQEDGSALLGPAPEMQMSSEFDENLADVFLTVNWIVST